MISISSSVKPPSPTLINWNKPTKLLNKDLICIKRGKSVTCRSLAVDAPFAAAIGACVLNSVINPINYDNENEDDNTGGAIDSTDARFAVMGIISFIPYFNWMSWVFAWLDSGKQRYLIYAVVYLAPYLRTNLSLSPDDSWLPIASIVACIIHVQLEASIKNGDFNGIQFFGKALNLFSPSMEEDSKFESHQEFSKKVETKKDHRTKEEFEEWGIRKHLGEYSDKDDEASKED